MVGRGFGSEGWGSVERSGVLHGSPALVSRRGARFVTQEPRPGGRQTKGRSRAEALSQELDRAWAEPLPARRQHSSSPVSCCVRQTVSSPARLRGPSVRPRAASPWLPAFPTANFSDSEEGLFTSSEIQKLMRIEYDRAQRYGYPMVLMLVEVDRLEYLHDLYGYESKEEILHAVIGQLRGLTRESDFLGCMSNERVLAAFPHTPERAAGYIAGRLLHGSRSLQFESGGRRIRITLSVGIAVSDPDRVLTFDEFFAEAHDSLSFAIRAGGDRYVRREPATHLIESLRHELEEEAEALRESTRLSSTELPTLPRTASRTSPPGSRSFPEPVRARPPTRPRFRRSSTSRRGRERAGPCALRRARGTPAGDHAPRAGHDRPRAGAAGGCPGDRHGSGRRGPPGARRPARAPQSTSSRRCSIKPRRTSAPSLPPSRSTPASHPSTARSRASMTRNRTTRGRRNAYYPVRGQQGSAEGHPQARSAQAFRRGIGSRD